MSLTGIARIKVTFVDKEGDQHQFDVAEGDNLLDIAQANDIEMEGMAPRIENPIHVASNHEQQELVAAHAHVRHAM